VVLLDSSFLRNRISLTDILLNKLFIKLIMIDFMDLLREKEFNQIFDIICSGMIPYEFFDSLEIYSLAVGLLF
jgi:hypothetical protein